MIYKILPFALLAIMTGSCDDAQSPNARFVDGMEVSLYHIPGATDYPWRLDDWSVHDDEEGQDIYAAAFGYQIRATIDITGTPEPIAGVRIDCYIEHFDPSGGDYDIWDKEARNGEKYGFVEGYPAPVIHWNHERGYASSKTDINGQVVFAIGLGNPEFEPDFDWKWPGGCNTMVMTTIKATFVIRRANGRIEKECHCYFLRGQCGGFWWPSGSSVWDTSHSSLAPLPSSFNMSTMMETMVISDFTPTEKGSDITLNAFPERTGAPNSYPMIGELVAEIQSQATESSNWEFWDIWDIGWGTLYWDSQFGWYWAKEDDVIKGLVSPDPNEPNDAVEMLNTCQPHAFFCEFIVESLENLKAGFHTFIVTSKDVDGNDVSWSPILMFPYTVSEYFVTMMSQYIIPIDSLVGEGTYFDTFGFPGTFIYVPEGGYLEVDFDKFYGDFNFDGLVDSKDFALFSEHWQQDMTDAGYDLQFDATQDFRTDANDLAEFVKNWLEIRQ